MITLSLSAALLAGLAGSVHCFAMCGGMAGALGLRTRAHSISSLHAATGASLYQFGRIGGYALAGALCGFAGSIVRTLLDLARLGATLRVASGVLMILIALRLLVRWNALAPIERWGARFWARLRPLTSHTASRTGALNALALGFLWGWLPCGLVYSMLLFAATSANAIHGALIMATFGLGTLPSMLTSSWLAPQLSRLINVRWSRAATGTLLLAFGAWMVVAANGTGQHAGHEAAHDHAAPVEHVH